MHDYYTNKNVCDATIYDTNVYDDTNAIWICHANVCDMNVYDINLYNDTNVFNIQIMYTMIRMYDTNVCDTNAFYTDISNMILWCVLKLFLR